METIRLNNLAASMLFCGNEKEAMSCLQVALGALRGLFQQFEKAQAAGSFARRSHNSSIKCMMEQSTPFQVTAVQPENQASEGSVEGAFQFYDKVFLISADPSLCLSPDQLEELQYMLLAVITYNIGYVSQRIGIKYGASRYFDKAIRFYDFSSSTIESIHQEHQCGDALLPLKCGLMNNIGYMHARSNAMAGSQLCLDWLQRTVKTEVFLFCDSMCEDDYYFFSQCAFYSLEGSFRAAAAA